MLYLVFNNREGFSLQLSSRDHTTCVLLLCPQHTFGAKLNLSAHLLLISDDMSDAKWEIWISFLGRQSLIHWQTAQMWEDGFSPSLDPELVRSFRVSCRPENQVGKVEQWM